MSNPVWPKNVSQHNDSNNGQKENILAASLKEFVKNKTDLKGSGAADVHLKVAILFVLTLV